MNEQSQNEPSTAHDHSHTVDQSNEKRVLWALLITALFMVAEIVGGILSGSLVLLADAGHMLVDIVALALSWLGFRIARRPPDAKRSYGYHRFPVLAAYTNGLSLFFISAGIIYEAADRLVTPPDEILGGVMLAVAAAGLAANIVCYLILSSGSESNINLKSALLHVLSDLLGSVAAIVAAVVIMYTDWMAIDPILSIIVCLLILRSAWKIVAKSGHILMQGTPTNFDVEQLRSQLSSSIDAIEDVHHIHVWELTEGKPVVSLHVRIGSEADAGEVLRATKEILRDRFDLQHSDVQIECGEAACPD